jgi:hypothetical protein
MTTDIVQKAADTLKPFKNASSLTACFQGAVNLSKSKNGLSKMHAGVLLASDDLREISTFANAYTEALHSLGTIGKNQLVVVDWQNMVEKDGLREAFDTAAGGVLIIVNAYGNNRTQQDQMANYTASGELCELLDKAGFDPVSGQFREAAAKPVVILSGPVAALQAAYKAEPAVFNMRFLNKAGF